MDGHLALDHDTIAWAQTRIVGSHDDLAQRRSRLRAGARDLLTGAWRGVAADQYAEAWAEWDDAAGQVLEFLLDLSAAVTYAAAQLEAADVDSAFGVGGLEARLGVA